MYIYLSIYIYIYIIILLIVSLPNYILNVHSIQPIYYIIHVVIMCEMKGCDKTRPKGVAHCITHCASNCVWREN